MQIRTKIIVLVIEITLKISGEDLSEYLHTDHSSHSIGIREMGGDTATLNGGTFLLPMFLFNRLLNYCYNFF